MLSVGCLCPWPPHNCLDLNRKKSLGHGTVSNRPLLKQSTAEPFRLTEFLLAHSPLKRETGADGSRAQADLLILTSGPGSDVVVSGSPSPPHSAEFYNTGSSSLFPFKSLYDFLQLMYNKKK